MRNEVLVKVSEIKAVCIKVLKNHLKINGRDANEIFNQLISAELMGKKTHGLVRIPWLLKRKITGHVDPVIISCNSQLITVFDCKDSIGYISASYISKYIKKNKSKSDFQIVVAKNIFPTGVLSYYNKLVISNSNSASVILGSTPKLVKLEHGNERMFGTNPLSIGFFETNENFFVLDITTSQSSFGELLESMYYNNFDGRKYHTSNNTIPDDPRELFDNEGIFSGSILQTNKSKSDRRQFGLLMALELITGILADGDIGNPSLIFIVFNKNLLGDKKSLEKGLERIKNAIGIENVPGMHSYIKYKENQNKEALSLPRKLWDEIVELN